jgi:hypothetical protein
VLDWRGGADRAAHDGKSPRRQPLRLRNWLRAEQARDHPLLAGHVHASRWEFSQADAERLIGEFRAAEVSASAGHVRQKSDSAVQRRAEDVIRGLLAESLGRCLQARTIKLTSGASVQVDAVADDGSVLAEIFARRGTLKPGQQKKVAIDTSSSSRSGMNSPKAS